MRNLEMGPYHRRKPSVGSAATPRTERGIVEGDIYVPAPVNFQPSSELRVISQLPSGKLTKAQLGDLKDVQEEQLRNLRKQLSNL